MGQTARRAARRLHLSATRRFGLRGLPKPRWSYFEADHALVAPFRLIRALVRLVHGVFELVAQFADKSSQGTVPLWADVEAIYTPLEGVEEGSCFRVHVLQLVDHDEQYGARSSAERARFNNHSGKSPQRSTKCETLPRSQRGVAAARLHPIVRGTRALFRAVGGGRPRLPPAPARLDPDVHASRTCPVTAGHGACATCILRDPGQASQEPNWENL
jgi:hypothetical protein